MFPIAQRHYITARCVLKYNKEVSIDILKNFPVIHQNKKGLRLAFSAWKLQLTMSYQWRYNHDDSNIKTHIAVVISVWCMIFYVTMFSDGAWRPSIEVSVYESVAYFFYQNMEVIHLDNILASQLKSLSDVFTRIVRCVATISGDIFINTSSPHTLFSAWRQCGHILVGKWCCRMTWIGIYVIKHILISHFVVRKWSLANKQPNPSWSMLIKRVFFVHFSTPPTHKCILKSVTRMT